LDAKRIIPMLKVARGQAAEGGRPAAGAALLELAGADGLLFEEDGAPDLDWVREVAAAVFLPFAVTCGTGLAPDARARLEAGADAVVVPGSSDLPHLATEAQGFGCQALRLAVTLDWAPGTGWTGPGGREAMGWLAELGERGELLLALPEAQRPGLDTLGQGLARLPVAVLVATDSWDLGREALLHGADGLVYPAGLGSPAACKAFMKEAGIAIRE